MELVYYTSWADFNKTIKIVKIKNNNNLKAITKERRQTIYFFSFHNKDEYDEFSTLVGISL